MPSLWSDSQDSFDMCLSVKTRFLTLPRLPVLIFSVSSVPGTLPPLSPRSPLSPLPPSLPFLRPLSLHPPHPSLLSYLSLVSGTVELTRSLLSPALSCTCGAVLSSYSLCSSTQVCAYTYVHTPWFNWGWLENSGRCDRWWADEPTHPSVFHNPSYLQWVSIRLFLPLDTLHLHPIFTLFSRNMKYCTALWLSCCWSASSLSVPTLLEGKVFVIPVYVIYNT